MTLLLSEAFSTTAPPGHHHELGKSYKYRVKACAGSGPDKLCSIPLETPASFVFTDLPKLDAPSAQNGSDGDGDYDLSWTQVGATGVRYELGERAEGDLVSSQVRTVGDNITAVPYEIRDKPGHASYFYSVKACVGAAGASDAYCGEWSDESGAVSVILAVPEDLASTASAPINGNDYYSSYTGSYGISWSALSYAYVFTYETQEKLPSAADWPTGNGLDRNSSDTSYTPSAKDLDMGAGRYEYRVRACTDLGCGAWSSVVAVNAQRLSAPQNLRSSDADAPDAPENIFFDGGYTIEWDAVEGAAAYRILQKAPGQSGFHTLSLVTDLSNLSYRDTIVEFFGEGVYVYKIQACAESGCPEASNGEESAELSIIYAVIPQVDDPALCGDAVVTAEGNYKLCWPPLSDAPSGVTVSYTLREIPRPGTGSCPGDDDDASWVSAVSVGISGRQSEELEKGFGSAFCYRVQACYGSICGDWSGSFLVEVPVPGAPSLSLEDKDGDYDNSYTLRWTETAGADSYELKEWAQGESEPSSGSDLGGDGEKAYADMAYNKEYRYKARACTGWRRLYELV